MTKKLTFLNDRKLLSELIPAEWNPRQLTQKQKKDLEKSLVKFGLAEVPIINLDGMIIAGHQRTKILFELHGDIEIDVRVPSRLMTEQEVKEYNIRSNKNTGEFDFDALANNFELDELIEWGFMPGELINLDDFDPATEDDQGKLDEKKKKIITCPCCGHEFDDES